MLRHAGEGELCTRYEHPGRPVTRQNSRDRAVSGRATTSGAEPPHGRQRRVLVVVAGILVLGFGGSLVFSGLQSSSRAASPGPPETSSRAIRVLGIRPRPGAEDVSFDASITVRLSAAPRTGMPSPRLSPPVSGTWTSLRGVLLVFHPSASYLPDTTYRLEIALASRTSSRSRSRRAGESPPARSTVESSFTTEAGSTLRLEQLLAELSAISRSASGPQDWVLGCQHWRVIRRCHHW